MTSCTSARLCRSARLPSPLSDVRPSVSPSCRDGTVTSDDLLSWLHPFCGDAALPVRPRIAVLQILESNFSLRDSDVRLLLLYRTQAVLKDRQVRALTRLTGAGLKCDESQTVQGGGGLDVLISQQL